MTELKNVDREIGQFRGRLIAAAAFVLLAFVLLGILFNVNGTLWCLALAAFTAGASSRIRLPARAGVWLNRTIGALMLSFGVKLALSSR